MSLPSGKETLSHFLCFGDRQMWDLNRDSKVKVIDVWLLNHPGPPTLELSCLLVILVTASINSGLCYSSS